MPNRSLSISLARFAPSFFFLSLSLSSHLCRHQFPFLTKILYLLFNPFFKVILLLLSSPKISPFFFFRSSELSNLIWILKFFSFLLFPLYLVLWSSSNLFSADEFRFRQSNGAIEQTQREREEEEEEEAEEEQCQEQRRRRSKWVLGQI